MRVSSGTIGSTPLVLGNGIKGSISRHRLVALTRRISRSLPRFPSVASAFLGLLI